MQQRSATPDPFKGSVRKHKVAHIHVPDLAALEPAFQTKDRSLWGESPEPPSKPYLDQNHSRHREYAILARKALPKFDKTFWHRLMTHGICPS
jgi:hypothetical protein